jgi:DNA-binding transcriptional LysR family regulator
MDRMASMAAFTKVVGAGSFSAAAREMQVSQALVTKQIQEPDRAAGRGPRGRHAQSDRPVRS